jgi:hypothetical protein
MIKRDRIQRVIIHKESDGQGGTINTYEEKEYIDAHVSIISTYGDATQFGIKDELVIHTTTAAYLDTTSPNVRYKYSNKYFKILRQVPAGNEFFCVMKQVND